MQLSPRIYLMTIPVMMISAVLMVCVSVLLQEAEVLRFEVDESGLTQLLSSLKDVEELIKSHTNL